MYSFCRTDAKSRRNHCARCPTHSRVSNSGSRYLTALCILATLFLSVRLGPGAMKDTAPSTAWPAEKLPPDVPAFLRNACDQLAYSLPNPTAGVSLPSWRLKRSQEPDHFINLEVIQGMEFRPTVTASIAHWRPGAQQTPGHPEDLLPERVGLQPYVDHRGIRAAGCRFPRVSPRAAGASQPRLMPRPTQFSMPAGWDIMSATAPIRMHTSIHYNGWIGPNPKAYTTPNTVHWKMEGIFVAANFKQLQFADLVPAQPQLLTDPFQDYMHYLVRLSQASGDRVSTGERRRLRRQREQPARAISSAIAWPPGQTMLRNMWYSAWIQSGQGSNAPVASESTGSLNPTKPAPPAAR